jgi:hypothetical protein
MDVRNNAGVGRYGLGDLGARILIASASHLDTHRRGDAERQCGTISTRFRITPLDVTMRSIL